MTREECRLAVIKRACGCCERCGVPVRDTFPDWHWRRAAVNEKVPRSSGGDPTDPENCELLCRLCHQPDGQHAPTEERGERLRDRRREEWP